MFKITALVCIPSSHLINSLKCAMGKTKQNNTNKQKKTKWKQEFMLLISEWEQNWLDTPVVLGNAHRHPFHYN